MDNMIKIFLSGTNASVEPEGIEQMTDIAFLDFIKYNIPLKKVLKNWLIENKKYAHKFLWEDMV